uniref:Uncharacterized protein n=1 Tax=Chlamydomonas euryale TaxID=1486919 RepID=A0A7R9VE86_9CHLO|mmetsp:Transcript_33191/g.98847  ORF Transcript_33191/g.98847 Transcript_33191/m.98847 type:complete len:143 (+) Transcript_33191:184-612(+)
MLASSRTLSVNVSSNSTAAPRAVAARAPMRSLAASSRMAYTGCVDAPAAVTVRPQGVSSGAPRRAATTMMGNKGSGGPFAPLVVVTRNIVGEKDFNKLRGKAISLHSQVIKEFCKLLGVENKQVQGVIRLAKKNGEKLGFLA